MPLAELLMERFKVKTRAVENPEAVTAASTTAQKILANNPNRFAFIIVNLGDQICFVGLERNVEADVKGIRLDANGGSFSCIWDEDFQMTGWAWWIIGEGASAVYAIEVVEY